MPSRDLVVQNEGLRREVEALHRELEEVKLQREQWRREAIHQRDMVNFTRQWRAKGIGSEPVVFFPIPPERKVAIPMSQDHCAALLDYLNRLEGLRPVVWEFR